jgi:phenol 2-monooxygenase
MRVGDGAHSKVRKSIPDAKPVGMSQPSVWGVLDGELDTDFPDIWSKTLVYSQEHGSILIIPRERNMTRFYIELKSGPKADQLGQEFVMQRAKEIMAPFRVRWKYIEWFGRYQIGQRVANRFCDNHLRAFLAGDASHTHSPKAAQGMNTSMHDAWNLCWKLNLAVRGLAKPALLESYEEERRKIALDLVNFDYEHANRIAGGDAVALAENFKTNVRFISGIGAEYGENAVNMMVEEDQSWVMGEAKPGCLLPPAKVTRYIDSNPVDIQLDIPMLGQFRIYLLMWDVHQSRIFLETFMQAIARPDALVSRLSAAASISYAKQPRAPAPEDIYLRPERYTAVSHLFTFALISKLLCPSNFRMVIITNPSLSHHAQVGNRNHRPSPAAPGQPLDRLPRRHSRAGHARLPVHQQVAGQPGPRRGRHRQRPPGRLRRLHRPLGLERRRRRRGRRALARPVL